MAPFFGFLFFNTGYAYKLGIRRNGMLAGFCACYKLQVTSYKLQVTSYKLQVTSCKLQVLR